MKGTFMIISANEIKTKGVSIFSKLLSKCEEVIINVRGKNKYVVMDIKRYKYLRELELDAAYQRVMEDIKTGNYKIQKAHQHVNEIANAIQNSDNRNLPKKGR